MTPERLEEIKIWAETILHHGEKCNIIELLCEIEDLQAEIDKKWAIDKSLELALRELDF